MKIGVLMGGISSEREISLLSGKEICENLDKNKYEIFPIIINSKDEVIEKVKGKVDFVFIALHGAFGEDGSVQALLESIDIKYTGSNMLTSAICMDKKQSKRIMKSENVNVAKEYIATKFKDIDIDYIKKLGYPLVVKPNNGGSSIGTFLVKNEKNLENAIEEAFKYDNEVIVEEYLKGKEYTIPMLNGKVLPTLEIEAKGEFFDYKSKYDDGGAKENLVVLEEELQNKMNDIAKRCWEIFNCKAMVRVDMIVSENVPYVLELNTLPGMTKNSLFPKSAKGINMSYSELLDNIIEYSLM